MMSGYPTENTTDLTLGQSRYFNESRGPLASLVFVAPLLILYELGLFVFGAERIQNGADAWLREFLRLAGFTQYFLLPMLTVFLLVAWHYTTHSPWRIPRGRTFGRMAIECAMLSVVPLLLWKVLLVAVPCSISAGPTLDVTSRLGLMFGYLGAGIYEELLFRVAGFSIFFVLVDGLLKQRMHVISAAVVLSSFVFAMAHYIGPTSDIFDSMTFLFRWCAGGFFAVLYVWRGFGIAVGAHAAYDILAGVLLR